MEQKDGLIATIVTGIITIAGLIFRAKYKTKTTRRKTKTKQDQENQTSINNQKQ